MHNAGEVDVEWRLFSLQLINAPESDPLADVHARGTPALRALALVRREAGNDAVGRVYEALGHLVHERGDGLSEETMRKALEDAGLDGDLLARALQDSSTMDDVRSEHDAVVAQVGAFGVPTIVLPSGKGIFGPVIASAPSGDDAVELWRHVRWLTERDEFFELKRDRDREPGP